MIDLWYKDNRYPNKYHYIVTNIYNSKTEENEIGYPIIDKRESDNYDFIKSLFESGNVYYGVEVYKHDNSGFGMIYDENMESDVKRLLSGKLDYVIPHSCGFLFKPK